MILCGKCANRGRCTSLCTRVRQYANQGLHKEFKAVKLAAQSGDENLTQCLLDPEKVKNDPIEDLTVFACDPDDIVPKVTGNGFNDEQVRELYVADLLTAYRSVKIFRQRTPAWAYRHGSVVRILDRNFRLNQGVREIARKLDLSPGYVSRVVSQGREVLLRYLHKVFPCEAEKTFVYKYFFEQMTVAKIAQLQGVSHQMVSISIRRAKKKLKKELLKTVANKHKIRGREKFSPFRNKSFSQRQRIFKNQAAYFAWVFDARGRYLPLRERAPLLTRVSEVSKNDKPKFEISNFKEIPHAERLRESSGMRRVEDFTRYSRQAGA